MLPCMLTITRMEKILMTQHTILDIVQVKRVSGLNLYQRYGLKTDMYRLSSNGGLPPISMVR